MRRASVLAALAATFAFASSVAAQTPDVSGTWMLSWETPRGAQTVTMTFKQDGTDVTGTAQLRMGEVPIKNGKIDGDQLTFVLELGRGDRTFSQTFTAAVKDDGTMEGTITTPRGENPFKGTRKED
ncbi:MAG: hypothetical protein PVJ02_08205 [Gemmatimonadota bacterium]|jgi:hypothetical protein